MKTLYIIFTSFLLTILLAACEPQSAWISYTVNEVSPNSDFLPYSFEYPSTWVVEQGVNHITFVSEAGLLTDVPNKLGAGQIITGLSMNINMSPEDIVDAYVSMHDEIIEFKETVPITLNGHPAAYKEGVEIESGDEVLLIVMLMDDTMRGLLSSKMAENELETWRDTLLKMMESLHVNS